MTMNRQQQPLVSCVMPTYNRREFVPYAIHYFQCQDYENRELIIIDDGTDNIQDLIPNIPTIRYFRLDNKATLGAKLNMACSYAKGAVIVNWDDDDWYATRRITYQVTALQNEGTDVCGINKLLYYDLRSHQAYQYIYPADQRTWLLGSSLCYTRDLWNRNHFADINVGMDGLFVWGTALDRITVLPDSTFAVHMIHDSNVSPKKIQGSWWHTHPVEDVSEIMKSDWHHYSNGNFSKHKTNIWVDDRQHSKMVLSKRIKNVYACLVHEDEDSIIDLVRNLHYHDPDSIILLYNGGANAKLIQSDFPFEKFGAVLHPQPVPVKHGYLHTFALKCMEFALDNFSFDSITMVDSDQLSIRSGYSEYIGQFLSAKANVGMLSSLPERVTPGHTNPSVWPAVQAFKEYELWKPFLQKFPNGESKFVHWTFWPSTVFAKDAVKDLVKIFNEDMLLQQIMTASKIWASEEVILPTLVKLLGYEILLNPCSYEFVKYQKTYNLQELNNALNKTDAYWIHPVERKYENELRKYTRQQFNHYLINNDKESVKKNSTPDMLTTFSLINKIKNIEGWLSDPEADLLIGITLKACKEIQSPQHIVEVGSYHGKSTVLLGSVVKEYFPGAKVYAIDPHEGTVGAVDEGIHATAPTLEIFKKNISNACLSEVVETIKNYSYNVAWDKPISLLFIDGLHDYPNVARDFWHFNEWVIPGAYVAFHDYSEYYPGVRAFVDELLATAGYTKISCADSAMIIQKL